MLCVMENSEPIYSLMPDTMKVGEKTYTELVDGKNHFVSEMQEQYPDPKVLLQEGLQELGKSTDPSQLTIRYASRGTDELSKKIGEWMKQTWEENLGINVQIDMMEWNIMWDKIDAGDYDIAQGGWDRITMSRVHFFSFLIQIMVISTLQKQDGQMKSPNSIKNCLKKLKISLTTRKGRDLSGGGKSGCRKCIDCADLPGGITDLCEKLCEKLFCNDKWNSGFFTGID